jgi:hypothetical protein
MDAAEMNAKRIDANKLNRLTANEPGRASEIKNAAQIRHLKFVTDRQKTFDAMKAAEARELRSLSPNRSAQRASVVQNGHETYSGIANQVLAASVLPSAPETPHPQSTVEPTSASPPPISPDPEGALVSGNEQAVLRENSPPRGSPLGQTSYSSHRQDHHRQALPSQHMATSACSSAPTSLRSQKRSSFPGQITACTALSYVSTCDSQDSYHTAAIVVPHTPGFARSDPSLSQTNLAAGPLGIPTTLTEGVATQTWPSLGQSPETSPTVNEHRTSAPSDSGPPSLASDGESPEDDQISAIGQSSQSLPLLTDKHPKHDVDDIAISVADAATSI